MEEELNNSIINKKRGVNAPFFMHILSFLENKFTLIGALLFVILFSTIRNYFLPEFEIDSIQHVTHYNNFIIFRNSFYNLINHLDLYIHYPKEQYDLFKYTPTFALLFGAFALLPKFLGLLIWNTINAGLPLLALSKYEIHKNRRVYLYLILPEIFTTILNSQSNGILIGLILLAFHYFINGHNFRFILLLTLTAFIKLFSIVGLLILLTRPKTLYKNILYCIFTFALFSLLPLMVINLQELITLYKSYMNLLENDHSSFVKLSIFGWFHNWFNIVNADTIVLIIGVLSIIIPIFKLINNETNKISLYFFSLCIWMVIFNHMAESATYIIAVTSIYAYLLTTSKISRMEWILFILLIIFTEFGPSDIYPKSFRIWIVESAQLKFLPCFLFWILLNIKIFRNSKSTDIIQQNS